MLKEERFEIILGQLEKEKNVTYETFASLLDVSEDTVRRDIDYLYRNGLLTKVRGGAMLRMKNPLSFNDRISKSTKEKDIIAVKAQQFVKSGNTIFMDGGTTVCQMVSCFPSDIILQIITNNPEVIPIVSQMPNVKLIMLGGTYIPEIAVTADLNACMHVNSYIADVYFMGTCAIDHNFGASTIFARDSEVKRAMVKSAKKVVVLADHTKLHQTEPFKAAEIADIDVLITDLKSEDAMLDKFRGIGLHIV